MERPGRWAAGSLVHEILEPIVIHGLKLELPTLGLNVARMLDVHGTMRILVIVECQDEIYE
jgi:hypothetical protein